MIRLDIQGFGILELRHFVTDFSGTLAEDGVLLPGIKERLNELSDHLTVHVITSDTFGRAREELKGITCRVQVLEGERHLLQKETYVRALGEDGVAAAGNGNNDTGMLKAARLGICVCMKEGCSMAALNASQVLVPSPMDAIDLLLNPKRLTATLRM
ncbi:MAG: ATPase P [Nitrospirae bacterium]|nr:ATPase P [Nitrospirota bacterium]